MKSIDRVKILPETYWCIVFGAKNHKEVRKSVMVNGCFDTNINVFKMDVIVTNIFDCIEERLNGKIN